MKKNYFFKFMLVGLLSLFGMGLSFGQTTIALQDFESSPGTPTWTFSNTNGDFSTGTGPFPSGENNFVSGTRGFEANNETATLTFATIDVSSYSGIEVSFRLASFAGTSGNGADGSDDILVEFSTDGGTTWSSEIEINGNNNARWSFDTGSGSVTEAYDGDNNPQNATPSSGGNQTTEGYSTLTVSNLPSSATLRLRITMSNNSSNEFWIIDDVELTGTLLAIGTSTLSTSASLSEPATISALNTEFTGAVAPQTNAVANFDFDFSDDNGSGGDSDATQISEIVFNAGTGNGVSDWSDVIANAQLSDGTNTLTSTSVGASSITFSSIPNAMTELGYIADDNSKTYTLTVRFLTSLTNDTNQTIDGQDFVFEVDNGSFTFVEGGLASSQNIDSGDGNNTVAVVASAIAFVQQPSNTAVNSAMSPDPSVEAIDANGNRDIDYTTNISLVSNGTMNAVAPVSPSSGIATFSGVTHTVVESGRALTASSGAFSDIDSNTFDIEIAPVTPTAGTVFITEIVDADSDFNAEFIELFNNSSNAIDLSTSKLVRVNSGTNASEYVFDFGTDESTADTDAIIPANGFLIIARGATRAEFNTEYGITLDAGVNYNGGNSNNFFGNGRRWRLRVGGTVNSDDGTLIDDTDGAVGSDRDVQNIFTGVYSVDGNHSNANPGELDYLVYTSGGSWVNSTAIDATTGSTNVYFYNDFTISSDSDANDVGINTGVTLTINSANNLDVNGDLTINGDLTMNSGATMIVDGTSSGNVTYNRTLTAIAGDGNGWHLVASPVAGETFDNTYATANSLATSTTDATRRGLGVDYVTATNSWEYLSTTDSNAGTFMSGIGYSMKRSATGDVSFTGTVNTDNVNGVAVSTAGGGFNLLGNPYTSYMSSQTFLTANTNTTGEIWTWTDASGYTARAAVQNFVLAPAQGFFVDVTSGSTVDFAESNQAASGDSFQRTSLPEVELTLSKGSETKLAQVLYFNENVTTGFDWGYEARLFGGVTHSFAVFTHLVSDDVGEKLQVQSLPNSDYENMIIPVGVISDGGEVTFTSNVSNLPAGYKVFLEDKNTGNFIRLDEQGSEYKVTFDSDVEGIGRFFMHMTTNALSTGTVDINNISAYVSSPNNLRVVGIQNGATQVRMFNILGKQVVDTSFKANGMNDVVLPNLQQGVYIVQIASPEGTINKKIVIE